MDKRFLSLSKLRWIGRWRLWNQFWLKDRKQKKNCWKDAEVDLITNLNRNCIENKNLNRNVSPDLRTPNTLVPNTGSQVGSSRRKVSVLGWVFWGTQNPKFTMKSTNFRGGVFWGTQNPKFSMISTNFSGGCFEVLKIHPKLSMRSTNFSGGGTQNPMKFQFRRIDVLGYFDFGFEYVKTPLKTWDIPRMCIHT